MFPGLAQLRGYRRSWLRGDLLAGITVAAYPVPQVMAYAGLAGLPAVAGLWAILPSLLVYAELGSSRQLSVGPESTTALMTATVVAPLAAGDAGRYAALALAVGLLALAAWLLRLGFVADLLSQPILVGYLAGVAVIMILGQLEKVSGTPVEGDGFAGAVVRAQRGGQRRGRHHGPGRARRAAPGAGRPGRRRRARPGQAGPARRAAGVRAGRQHRRRPDLPTLPTALAAYERWAAEHPARSGPASPARRTGDGSVGE